MKKKSNNKFTTITSLIFTSFLLLSLIPLSVISYVSLTSSSNLLTDQLIQDLEKEGNVDSKYFIYQIDSYIKDLRLIQDISPLTQYIEDSSEELNKDIVSDFNALLSQSTSITQLRLIDKNGIELIRLNSENGITTVIPKTELQDKSDRYYFSETISLSKHNAYVSTIDLNKEGSPPEIHLPYEPTIRIGIPLINNNDESVGILIANINSQNLFHIYLHDQTDFEYIIDKDGYYIVHPDSNKLYGSLNNLNTGENFAKDFPMLAKEILENQNYSPQKINTTTYVPTVIKEENSTNFWIKISLIEQAQILKPVEELLISIIKIFLSSFFIILAFALVISNLIGSPIKRLKEEVEAISFGNLDHTVSIPKQNELAGLAKAFNKMTATLKEYRDYLEKKVSSRTTKLETLAESMIGRELRMIKLKKELAELKKKKND